MMNILRIFLFGLPKYKPRKRIICTMQDGKVIEVHGGY